MWKIDFVKLVHKLNAYLNAIGVGKLPLIRGLKRRIIQLFRKRLISDSLYSIKVDGMVMNVYAYSSECGAYVLRPYEPYTTELFRQAVKPGATVLDIGAQFGYFSLIAAKRVGKKGKVYAFEPVPANFQLLERNIQMNGYTDIVHIVKKAVGDRHTTVPMFIYEYFDSHSMYRNPDAPVKETILVECITIDEFLAGQSVDVVKMDIEGNEPYALAGMKKTISKSDNLILFAEFAPAHLRRAGVNPKDYIIQLTDLGFDIQVIDENSHCLRPVTEEIFRIDNSSGYVNLYCTKRKHFI